MLIRLLCNDNVLFKYINDQKAGKAEKLKQQQRSWGHKYNKCDNQERKSKISCDPTTMIVYTYVRCYSCDLLGVTTKHSPSL